MDAIIKSLFAKGWNEHCSDLVKGILDRVEQGTAKPLTEARWKDYIKWYMEQNWLGWEYHPTTDDILYGQVVIEKAYPQSWTKIRLTDMTIPEIYQGEIYKGN